MSGSSNVVSVLRGDGHGGLAAPITSHAGDGPTTLTAAHLDGNSNIDLVVGNANSFALAILRGDGAGHFTFADVGVDDVPRGVVVADLGDGFVDLVATNETLDMVSLRRGSGTR